MRAEASEAYRQRIYGRYVSARDRRLAPRTLTELKPRLPYLRQIVRRHMPPDRSAGILELGCGHGALLYALHEAGYTNARGVDWAHEQVEAARQLGIAGVEQGDVMSVLATTADTSVDVLVAFDFVEHFTKVEVVRLVDEAYRVLRPGGRWIIHVPNAEAPFGSRMRYWDFTHELAFTRVSVAQLLRASGFDDVACFEDQPVAHGLKSMVRFLLWGGIRALLLLYLAVETGSVDRKAIFSQNLLAVVRRP